MKKDQLKALVKLVVGGLLVAVLLMTVDWRESLGLMARISILYAIALVAIGFFMIVISSLKWQILLSARGYPTPLWRLVLLYIVGYFFNNFLPSNVGGDVARSYVLGRQIRSLPDSFGTVFLERLSGVFGLLIAALVALIVNPRLLSDPRVTTALLVLLAALLGVIAFLFTRGPQRLLKPPAKWRPIVKIHAKAVQFLEVVYHFRHQRWVMAKVIAISLLFHLMTTVNTYAAALALGVDVSIFDIAVIVPIILVVVLVPVSPNAIGLWEGSFVYFFSLVGVPAPAALSIALTIRAKNLLIGLLGGAVLILWKWKLEGPRVPQVLPTSVVASKPQE